MHDPAVQAATAALQQAQLNLAHTTVTAPMAGHVTQVDHVQVGDYVSLGTPVLALIADSQTWAL